MNEGDFSFYPIEKLIICRSDGCGLLDLAEKIFDRLN